MHVEKIHQFVMRKDESSHVPIVATRRGGVFISESDGCIGIWCVALIDWKAANVSADDVSGVLFLEKGQDLSVLTLFVSQLSVLCNGAGEKGMN